MLRARKIVGRLCNRCLYQVLPNTTQRSVERFEKCKEQRIEGEKTNKKVLEGGKMMTKTSFLRSGQTLKNRIIELERLNTETT